MAGNSRTPGFLRPIKGEPKREARKRQFRPPASPLQPPTRQRHFVTQGFPILMLKHQGAGNRDQEAKMTVAAL